MKNLIQFFLSFAILFSGNSLPAQTIPSIEWQKCFGGSDDDKATSIEQTTDGGFIVAGWSYSNDSDVTFNHGQYDYWIVKLDTNHIIEWQKSLGGSGADYANSIQQTTDGGYIVAGYSGSTDGDVSGNHGAEDYWIVKLDGAGNIVWEKSLGGSDHDFAFSVQQLMDGGYIIAGYTFSSDGDVTANHGATDYWVVKLDTAGNLVWQKSFGGSNSDGAFSVEQTNDGGYIVAGGSTSDDGDVSGNHIGSFGNQYDYWIVKLDSAGNLTWQKCLGGSDIEEAYSVQQVADGGYVIAGYSTSLDGDVSCTDSYDFWIVKLDTTGNIVWQTCYGTTYGDEQYFPKSIRPTNDGGYIIAGRGDISYSYYAWFQLIRLDSSGNLIWQKSMGGSDQDEASSVQQTKDGGYIVVGFSTSYDGDVSGNHGYYDYWIVKLTGDIATGFASPFAGSVSVYPDPVQNQLKIKLPSLVEEPTISVYDLQGRMISLSGSFQSGEVQLDTENLPDGFYSLHIIDKKTGDEMEGKFVKQQ